MIAQIIVSNVNITSCCDCNLRKLNFNQDGKEQENAATLVGLGTLGHQAGNQLRTLIEGTVDNVVSESVQHAHGPQSSVGKAGGNSSGVGRGLDTVDHDVAVERVGVVQTSGGLAGNSDNSHLLSVLLKHISDLQCIISSRQSFKPQHLSNLDGGGNLQGAVDVEVVVSREEERGTSGGGELDEGGHGVDVAVREHVDLGEDAGGNLHHVANLQISHGLVESVLQEGNGSTKAHNKHDERMHAQAR